MALDEYLRLCREHRLSARQVSALITLSKCRTLIRVRAGYVNASELENKRAVFPTRSVEALHDKGFVRGAYSAVTISEAGETLARQLQGLSS